MVPKGKLLLIGGSEDKGEENDKDTIKGGNKEFQQFDILKELLPKRQKRGTIEIITTASEEPDEVAKRYSKAFKKLGLEKELGFMYIANRQEAEDEELVGRGKKSHAVFFSGGDQYK